VRFAEPAVPVRAEPVEAPRRTWQPIEYRAGDGKQFAPLKMPEPTLASAGRMA